MKRKRVYLFACIEKNIGDDLFIYTVSKRYPNVDFIISYKANYLKNNHLENLKYSTLLSRWLYFSNLRSDSGLKRIISILFEKFYKLILRKLDSIYIVGNAFKNMEYKGPSQIDWLNKRIDISNNFYLISTNYGPSNSKDWKNDCYKAFSKMTDVCFRDKKSYELFKDIKSVRYAPDAVLSLDINNYNSDNDKKYIIISIIDCSLENRSNKLKEVASLYEDSLSQLINEFNSNGMRIILLNSNTNQDYPAARRIMDKCNNKEMVSIYNYDGNINSVFEIYSNAKAVIATRLHTIILAWLYNIPVIPIVYDIKVDNMLKSYNFNELVENIYDLDNLNYLSIKKALDNYSFKISEDILCDANNQFKMIDKLLK